jgi:hypothetical protein
MDHFVYFNKRKAYGKSEFDIKPVFHFSLEPLFEICFVPINIYCVVLEMQAETHSGLHLKCLSF